MTTNYIIGNSRTALLKLPKASLQCCITSPPYFRLRNYGGATTDEIGQEETPEDYINSIVEVSRGVKHALRPDGIYWLNIGDSAAGVLKKPTMARKNVLLIPARTGIALQADGWILRAMLPWIRRSTMPRARTDRPEPHVEYVLMLTKQENYFYDEMAIRRISVVQPKESSLQTEFGASRDPACTRNYFDSDLFVESMVGWSGSITTPSGNIIALDINTVPSHDDHYAAFPPKLVEPLILVSTSAHGACAKCHAPYKRLVKKILAKQRTHGAGGKLIQREKSTEASGRRGETHSFEAGMRLETVGWAQTCACKKAAVVPCAALDPFAGSGTVGLVATLLNRNSVLVELNRAYKMLAERRIKRDAGFFAN